MKAMKKELEQRKVDYKEWVKQHISTSTSVNEVPFSQENYEIILDEACKYKE